MKSCSICHIIKSLENFHRKGKNKLRNECKICNNLKRCEYYKENKHLSKVYYISNKEIILNKNKVYAKNNNKIKIRKEKYRKINRLSINIYNSIHNKTVKGRINKLSRKKARNKRVRKATPKWVNKKDIINFYKNCPPGMHVDHIIPLNGVNVSGLHVPWNLQYLTAKENIKKSNKF